MKKYITPEIDIAELDGDILTFSLGELEEMLDGDGSPIKGAGSGSWGW